MNLSKMYDFINYHYNDCYYNVCSMCNDEYWLRLCIKLLKNNSRCSMNKINNIVLIDHIQKS